MTPCTGLILVALLEVECVMASNYRKFIETCSKYWVLVGRRHTTFAATLFTIGLYLIKLGGVILAGPGWDDNLGPTDITLNKMYRQRLMDPKLPQEFKCRMDVLTAYRSRMLSAVNLVHETTFLGGVQEAVFEIDLNVKDLSICFLSNLEGQPSASQSVGQPASGELKELKEEL
ncbi:hypothetical protein DAPPUDRAFT_336196 [Daphnia pulex]|uniref:Uncharacterized protein n=1 Tax=Daphnia pulex TaxID=6669 RepID=E9HZ98_DAPPU|nr:hypothetical protein DAPPUDRAFT_336196 [Daphnia pulex]|eukprot:EFX62932.1 hypothetical protein DAPPUDRAFT_336196 [Daphnia pulex]